MSIKNKNKPNTKILTKIILFIFFLFVLLILTKLLNKPKTSLQSSQSKGLVNQEKIEISGVKVNNFIKNKDTSQPYITIVATKEYHIFYISSQKLFYISIAGQPFDKYQKITEKLLLKELGISEEEACKLNVDITTLPFANPDKAGVIYDLSFCK